MLKVDRYLSLNDHILNLYKHDFQCGTPSTVYSPVSTAVGTPYAELLIMSLKSWLSMLVTSA